MTRGTYAEIFEKYFAISVLWLCENVCCVRFTCKTLRPSVCLIPPSASLHSMHSLVPRLSTFCFSAQSLAITFKRRPLFLRSKDPLFRRFPFSSSAPKIVRYFSKSLNSPNSLHNVRESPEGPHFRALRFRYCFGRPRGA